MFPARVASWVRLWDDRVKAMWIRNGGVLARMLGFVRTKFSLNGLWMLPLWGCWGRDGGE